MALLTSNKDPQSRSPEIAKLKSYLIDAVIREMERNPLPVQNRREELARRLETVYAGLKIQIPTPTRFQIFQEILDDILGFGAIQPLLEDEGISEVMVNGPSKVYIERDGKLIKTNITFENDDVVLHLIDKIISPLGRHIDSNSPTVDARLPDGSRVNAVISPCAIDGPSLTIRKFKKGKLTIAQLIEIGSLSKNMADFLRACVVSRLNVVVSGGTGSGKTTLLNALSSFIPSDERIVTIEDTAELRLEQDHVVRLETQPPNVEGQGAVSIRDLVRNSLRMRPDRIVVGEVRGGEALDMLQAMNTGHDGSLTTLHANAPRDALSRLETMCLMAGMEMPLKVIREQIASAVDLIVQQTRLKDGGRRITSVTEVSGMEGDTVVLSDIFKFTQTGISPEGKVIGDMRPTGIRPLFTPRLEANGFKLPPEVFGANLADLVNPNRRR